MGRIVQGGTSAELGRDSGRGIGFDCRCGWFCSVRLVVDPDDWASRVAVAGNAVRADSACMDSA
jgi:hypothetical protein